MTDGDRTVGGVVVDGPDGPALAGARCPSCAATVFGVSGGCPRCGTALEPTLLPRTGTVWTWTVQRLAPKPPFRSPDGFVPFAVGYVDLGAVKVESRLVGADRWHIGDRVALVVAPLPGEDESGRWGFAFAPEAAS
jgi:uncharacterized OB-fold protein